MENTKDFSHCFHKNSNICSHILVCNYKDFSHLTSELILNLRNNYIYFSLKCFIYCLIISPSSVPPRSSSTPYPTNFKFFLSTRGGLNKNCMCELIHTFKGLLPSWWNYLGGIRRCNLGGGGILFGGGGFKLLEPITGLVSLTFLLSLSLTLVLSLSPLSRYYLKIRVPCFQSLLEHRGHLLLIYGNH